MGFFDKILGKSGKDVKVSSTFQETKTSKLGKTSKIVPFEEHLKRLEDIGYGPLKIEELRTKFQKRIDDANGDINKAMSMIELDTNVAIRTMESDLEVHQSILGRLTDPAAIQEREEYFKDNHGFPIDLNSRIQTRLDNLREAGYGPLKISEFEQEFNEYVIKSNGDVKSAFSQINLKYKTVLSTIEKDKQIHQTILNRQTDPLVREETEESFRDNHGFPIDLNSRIQTRLDRLREAGYGPEKIASFETEFKRIAESNPDKLDLASSLINNTFRTAMTSLSQRKNVNTKIMDNINRSDSPDAARARREQEHYNNTQLGHTINIQERISTLLNDLSQAGYGKDFIEKFAKDYQSIARTRATDIARADQSISLDVNKRLSIIEAEKRTRDTILENKQNQTEFPASIQAFNALFGQGMDYYGKYVQTDCDITSTRFDVEHGHSDKRATLENLYMTNLVLHGCGNAITENIAKKFKNMHSISSGKKFIEELDKITSPYIRRNERDAALFMSPEADQTMTDIAKKMNYPAKDGKKGFIMDLLSKSDKERETFYEQINQTAYIGKKDGYGTPLTFEKDLRGIRELIEAKKALNMFSLADNAISSGTRPGSLKSASQFRNLSRTAEKGGQAHDGK